MTGRHATGAAGAANSRNFLEISGFHTLKAGKRDRAPEALR